MNVARAAVALLAVGVAGSGLPGCSNNATTPAKNKVPITTASKMALKEYLKGRDLAEKLRVTDARVHYSTAANEDPSFALAYVGLANTAPTAAEFFDGVRRATGLVGQVSEGEAHVIRALEAAMNSRPDEQLQHLAALVKAYPDDERARFLLGLFHFNRQEWPQAIAECRRSTELNPQFSQPYNQLGYALRFMEDYAGAEKAFTKYIELIPDEPNPYDSYAELLMKTGRFRDSIVQYQKALSLSPNFANSYIGIGNDYIFLGESVQARNSFTTLGFIARNDGERRTAHVWTAISYIHEGDTAKALNEVERMDEIAKKADDRFAMAGDLNLMGNILLEASQPDEALAAFNKAVEMAQTAIVTPDVKQATRRNYLFNAGRVAIARKDLAAAAATAEQYRRQVDEHKLPFEVWQSHELSGLIALASGDFPMAVHELEKANQQDPRVLFTLSRAYAGAGNGAAAKIALDRAVNYNAFSLTYAFVRTRAQAILKGS
jgi:tetratricopeptide (TPR) repeat protein